MWFRLGALKKSSHYAWRGLKYTFQEGQNFRIQLVIAVVVILLMVLLRIEATEAIALIFVIVAVLVLEILNTIVEKFIDLLQPRLHHYSEVIKDMMAGAVLLASLGSIVVGVLVFYPYVIPLFE